MRSPIEYSHQGQFPVRTRPRPASVSKRTRLRRTALEHLEPRTLMAVLPPVTHNTQIPNPVDISTAVNAGSANMSAPKIAVDPTDPNKLVAAWVDLDPTTFAPNVQSEIKGAYSTNGGRTWLALATGGNNLDPTTSNPTIPYILATDPSVAFDRQDHVYLLQSQHNNGGASGEFVLNTFDFSGSSPKTLVTNSVVKQWESNPGATPVLAVDSSVDSFTDPNTGTTQTDTFGGSTNIPGTNLGNVYVGWAVNNTYPFTGTVPATYNPNRIQVVASSNGGQSFGPAVYVDSTSFFSGNARYVAPTIAVGQGRAPGTLSPTDRGVTGGQVTVGFDDFNTGATATIPFDVLLDNQIQPGVGQAFRGGASAAAVATPFAISSPLNSPVQLDPRFTTLSNVSVTVNMTVSSFTNTSLTLVNNTTGVSFALLQTGLSGANLGIDGNGNAIGATFDLQAQTSFRGASAFAAPFAGDTFQPDGPAAGQSALSSLRGSTAATLNGQWTLVATNNSTDNATAQIVNWTLHFNSAMANGADSTMVAQNFVRNNAPIANSAMPQGIIPGMTFAYDDTLGSYSLHEGRLYAAYVDTSPAALAGIFSNNPADNTDIFLLVSDDGGVTWHQPNSGPVNDDNGVIDGFSEAATQADVLAGTAQKVNGRPQFEPAVAVDPATGTLVVSYLDTRYDPSRGRVATTIATSIDGGTTFGPQNFANLANTALDEITRQTTILGPIPDNQSGANTKTDATFGYGPSQGLAVLDGHIFPAWSSNQNGGLEDANNTTKLTIAVAPMVTAAGPRILTSTMGPVKSTTVDGTTFNNQFALDGTQEVTGFVVVFDRQIDINTFDPTSVLVQFLSPTGNPALPVGTPGGPVSIPVNQVTPLDATGGPAGHPAVAATTFLVHFTQPQSGVGTYSYKISANKIRDLIRTNPATVIITPGGTVTDASGALGLAIPQQGTGGTGTGNDFTNSTIAVGNVPINSVVSNITVLVNLNHTADGDLILTLIAPDGTSVILSQNNGNSGQNYTNTTFSDAGGTAITAGTPPYTGTFRPQNPLATFKGHPDFGGWRLQIQDTQAGNVGTLLNWSVTITTGTTSIVPGQQSGNLMDQNANGTTGQPTDFFAAPTPLGSDPAFTAPYDPNTLPIIVPGPHVIDTVAVLTNGNQAPLPPGQVDNPDNLVTDNTVSGLDVTFDRDMDLTTFTNAQVLRIMGPTGLIPITPQVTVVVSPVNANPAHVRTFRINFPTQQLSGTYTVTLDSSIKSAAGDKLDTNLNAGLDTLRGFSPAGTTTPIVTPAIDTPITIGPQKTIVSNIVVTNSFPIQGVTLTLNITAVNDPDLQASLIALDPGGDPTKNVVIPLFTGVGSAGGAQGFNNTVFDDAAATPIQNGGRPFFGTFKPQSPLGVLIGSLSATTYQLQITSTSAINTSTLNSWSLTLFKGVPGTGLGEPVADRAQASFRIFTMDPTNPLSSNTWTAVGPAAIGGGAAGPESSVGSRSGRIGGLAFDPSDPSGNTVYVAGASGGVWKTTNFLTTDPQGPTYIPLTDFGPTFGINIGGLAVFGRNNDTNQSVIFATTGEGDTASTGVGVLRSMDGGATWTLLDSSTNVDGAGNALPITSTSRDHVFVGTSSFKVVVDPNPTKAGGVIVYAALIDPTGQGHGGIWRSIDTGNHWTKILNGNATDIALDPSSGFINAFSNPTGNLQILYAALQGTGVFQSQNEGLGWSQLLGGIGNPFFQDFSKPNTPPIPITGSTAAPTGGNRIVLAKPSLALPSDPNATAENLLYEGWLYTVVVTPAGQLQGLYMTKDFGRNWTKLTLPNQTAGAVGGVQADPSNDSRLPTVDPLGNPNFGAQGNYDVSLIVDPTNPNVVYLGGTADGNATGLIRVDTTGVSDPYAFYLGENTNTSAVRADTTDPIGLTTPLNGPAPLFPPPVIDVRTSPTINMVRDPNRVFGNSTFYTNNATAFTNSGANVKWIPFDQAVGSTDQHRVVAIRDPLTGHALLIFGDDQGVFSDVINSDGTILNGIGATDDQGNPGVDVPSGSRNGNLQITQFYYGAAQASNIAAQVATLQGMFYGNAQDDGFPASQPNVIQPGQVGYGNLVWVGPGGDGGGVATDQNQTASHTGDVFQYKWPCCGGNITDFFQVNGIGQTTGLVRNINPPGSQVPDPQWPFEQVLNFAVNPLDADQIVISSNQGRLYRTESRGSNTWLPIGDPSTDPVFTDTSRALALAFGAPEPNPPGGSAVLDNFIYVGNDSGHIFVTFNGGGTGNWTNLSAGLDGSAVEAIVTNSTRGSHEAYAVTQNGIFHMLDSSVPGASWINITSNIFSLTHNPFGDATMTETEVKHFTLSSIQADWRYLIPNNLANPSGPTHPMLYVGGQAGVYRSLDGGVTWGLFSDSGAGSLLNSPYPSGGGLPIAQVTDLDLSLGFINPTTGQPDESTGSNVLLATTYGRGSFAIRLAPIVFPNSLGLDPNLPAPGGSDSGISNTDNITNVKMPFIDGLSEVSAFGNTVTINLIDETPTDATFGQIIGTGQTDAFGHLAHVVVANPLQLANGVQITANLPDGTKIIGVQAVNQSGTKGNIATFTYQLITTAPAQPGKPGLDPTLPPPVGSDTGLSPTDDITNIGKPVLDVTPSGPNAVPGLVQLLRDGVVVATVAIPAGPIVGHVTLTDPGPIPDGQHVYTAIQMDVAGNASTASSPLTVTFDTVPPNTPSTPVLDPADDSGIKGDGITNVTRPHLDGTIVPETVDPIAQVQILNSSNVVLGTAFTTLAGTYAVQFTNILPDGVYLVRIRAEDTAGNLSSPSGTFQLQIDTKHPTAPTIALLPADDSGVKGDNITNVKQPHLFGVTDPNVFVDLIDTNGNVSGTVGKVLATVPADNAGNYLIQFPAPLPDGIYHIQTQARDVANNTSLSPVLTLQIDTTPPTIAPTLVLLPADDTGIKGDGVTAVRGPRLTGVTEPFGVVQLIQDQIIPDNNQVYLGSARPLISSISTPFDGGAFVISDLAVKLDITHPRDSDLTVVLIDPSGGQHVLFSGVGGNGQNFTGTILDDQAPLPITDPSAHAPFTGSFQTPGKTLNSLVGLPLQGIWRLQITDNKPGPGGAATLNSWSLIATPTVGPVQTFRLPDTVQATGTADQFGKYTLQLPNFLTNGSIALQARATDVAGNSGPSSSPFVLTLTTVSGDYDDDGKADLPVFRSSTAQPFILESTAGGVAAPVTGSPGDIPLMGDFDGDGKTDLVTYNINTATWTIRRTTLGLETVQFGSPGDWPVPGDYDGDGKTDLATFTPSTDTWHILFSSGGSLTKQFGQPRVDIPAQAAYDGNLTTEIAVYRPTTAQWFVLGPNGGRLAATLGTPNAPSVSVTSTGTTNTVPGDVPIPSDYFGTGFATPAVFEPATANWRILNPTTNKEVDKTFGVVGIDAPVLGDYFGDGKTDYGVYRSKFVVNGTWLVVNQSGNASFAKPFGLTTDTPMSEPLPYLLLGKVSSAQVHALSAGGGQSGSNGAGGGASSKALNFGQQAAGLALGSPLSAPVTIPGTGSGLGGTASGSPIKTTSTTSASVTGLSVSNRRTLVNVALQTYEPLGKLGSSKERDLTLAAALLGLGRLKAGRFLLSHEA